MYIRCSGGHMNIHVYGPVLQRQHIAAGRGVGLLLLLALD